MKMKRKKVAVVFGGRSGEHVVSLRSAASIMEAIDKDKHDIIPIGITRDGVWITGPDAWLSLWENRSPREATQAVLLTDPNRPGLLIQSAVAPSEWLHQPLDVIFPVLHGTYGEDGTIQGLFEMAGIPYVGSGVLASSVAMDKVMMKTLFKENGLPVAPFIYFQRWDWSGKEPEWITRATDVIGLPCFVKPANLGSSVGITKVHTEDKLGVAVENALLYDEKVIVETSLEGREIECSVLGDLEPQTSRPGEVIPCNEFYDYRAKYIDDRSELVIPVELGEKLEGLVRDYSARAFKAVEASGLARVDFFVNTMTETVTLIEINTIPGFTSISMYPKLWEVSGVRYDQLVSRLLEIAEGRFQRRRSLMVSPPE